MTTLAKLPIIDIDTHLTEPGDLWSSRAPAKYRNEVLEIRRQSNGTDAWFFRDSFIGHIGPGVIGRDGAKAVGMVSLRSMDEMSLAGTKVEPRLEMMDAQNIYAAIIYPNALGFGSARLMRIGADHDLRLFHIQAYNDHVADMQRQSGGRLAPQAVLPLWDMDATLSELKRCRETLGLKGIVMTDSPQEFGCPSLADPYWDRLWAACQDFDVPVNIHLRSGEDMSDIEKGYWGKTGGVTTQASTAVTNPALNCWYSLNLFFGNIRDVANLILTGILDRFPRLKVVSVESGAGWVPFVIQSLEYAFHEFITREHRRNFKREPREYFKDQLYTSYWFENANCVDFYIKEFGADNLMFESDFPHPATLHPGTREQAIKTLSNQPEDVQRRVLYGTASKLYDIQMPADWGSDGVTTER
jgi:uncharacterized protein